MSTSTSTAKLEEFTRAIWENYRASGRKLPWRETSNPYEILVSEVMLQQTQVSRVLEKYREWLVAFPTVQSLAAASLKDVLSAWSGLGYNRRGKWLKECAEIIVRDFDGQVPRDPEALDALPGIGPYTARAVSTFAFGLPQVFIETNIRRVYIHFFFNEREASGPVADAELLPLIEKTLDRDRPRDWYYALMDYGADLPKYVKNPNRKSASYALQSPLKGSRREARGAILRALKSSAKTMAALERESGIEPARLSAAAADLCAEGFIEYRAGRWRVREG
jgi:A/G-specific adenine glycosylase